MKSSIIVTLGFLSLMLGPAKGDSEAKEKSSRDYAHHSFAGHQKPRFVSFDAEEGKIDIEWGVTIPFISVPLNYKLGENGETQPLLNINPKALGIAGLMTTILTLIVPIFSKPEPGINYHRSSDSGQWMAMGNVINDMIFSNSYVTPCMQRIVCTIVSNASHSDDPTSMDKIIDGFSSHKWFKEFTNGTVIQEAVTAGREGSKNCAKIYKNCPITPRMLKNSIGQLGIV